MTQESNNRDRINFGKKSFYQRIILNIEHINGKMGEMGNQLQFIIIFFLFVYIATEVDLHVIRLRYFFFNKKMIIMDTCHNIKGDDM